MRGLPGMRPCDAGAWRSVVSDESRGGAWFDAAVGMHPGNARGRRPTHAIRREDAPRDPDGVLAEAPMPRTTVIPYHGNRA